MQRIHKVGAVILRNGLLLVVRKRGTQVFISPGGKPEDGESAAACLRRELMEELRVPIVGHQLLGTFSDKSAFEDVIVDMAVHIVDVAGFPVASDEIEEVAWVDAAFREDGVALGSIFEKFVVPHLAGAGYLRPRRARAGTSARSVVVADLDGTLIANGSPLAPGVRNALHQLEQRGVALVYATSRAPRGAERVLGDIFEAATVICCNGALCVRRGEITGRFSFEAEATERICSTLERLGAAFYLEYGERFALAAPEPAFPEMRRYCDVGPLDFTQAGWASGVVKISVTHAQPNAILEACVAAVPAPFSTACHSTGVIDIGPPGVNKLAMLVDQVDLRDARLVVLGNDQNDFELLTCADEAYIVGDGLAGIRWPTRVTRVRQSPDAVAALLERIASAG